MRSFGQLGLTVYGVDVANQTIGEIGIIEATAGTEFYSWNGTRSGEVNLDFDSNVDAPVMSAQLNVDRNLIYLIFVDADVHVDGEGWPGGDRRIEAIGSCTLRTTSWWHRFFNRPSRILISSLAQEASFHNT